MSDAAGGGGRRSNDQVVRIRQVLIPLGIAAAATYAAIVRQEGGARHRRRQPPPPPAVAVPGPPSPWVAEGGDPVLPQWQPAQSFDRPPAPAPPADTAPAPVAPAEAAPAPVAPAEAEPAPPAAAEAAAPTEHVDEPQPVARAVADQAAPPEPTTTRAALHESPYPIAPATDDPADAQPSDDATDGAGEWTEMQGIPDLPAADADDHESAEPPHPEGPVLDDGQFSIGGWAAAPGHSVVSAVTYHHRLPVSVPAERVVLTIENSENVPEHGLVVLSDPGFAPDREGFTLLLAAADPGPFSASGTYRVIG